MAATSPRKAFTTALLRQYHHHHHLHHRHLRRGAAAATPLAVVLPGIVPRRAPTSSSAVAGASSWAPSSSAARTTHHPPRAFRRRAFSSFSSASSSPHDAAPPPSSSSSSSSRRPLRRLIRPFLRACHPDASGMIGGGGDDGRASPPSGGGAGGRRIAAARETNLRAVQTINGLVDVVEGLASRCLGGDDDGAGGGTLPELKARYEIVFALPPGGGVDAAAVEKRGRGRRDDDGGVSSTLRSVCVSFPEGLRSDVRRWALSALHRRPGGSDEPGARRAAERLVDHASSEFVRLLTVAGMEVPPDYYAHDDGGGRVGGGGGGRTGQRGEGKGSVRAWTLSDHFLHELGIDPTTATAASSAAPDDGVRGGPSSAYFGRPPSRSLSDDDGVGGPPPPPTYSHPHLARGRTAFVNSIPWDRFAKDYDSAFRDAAADWTTTQLGLYDAGTARGRERREEFVSRICANVRIRRQLVGGGRGDGGDGDDDDDDNNGADRGDDVPEGLDVVAQLVAMRRLSILLCDSFDALKMEKMGRMWERLVIVLTPPRRGVGPVPPSAARKSRDGTPVVHPGRKLTKWERRKKRRERLEPSSRGSMRHDAENYRERMKRKAEEVGVRGESPAAAAGAINAGEDEGQARRPTTPSPPRQETSEFKFSYGTRSDQGVGHVTAHVPIDFRDGELIRQLQTHVREYFDNCCGNVGFLRYGADGVIRADVGDVGAGGADRDGVDEHDDGGVDEGEWKGMGMEREMS